MFWSDNPLMVDAMGVLRFLREFETRRGGRLSICAARRPGFHLHLTVVLLFSLTF